MITRLQKVRLGVFFIVSVVLLLGMIFVIVAPKLFESLDVYYISYSEMSVTGLNEGGAVKYHGLTVGTVTDIFIDPEDIRNVVVEVSLDEGTPIKEDTYADVALVGITGLKLIELRGGTNETAYLKPGDYISPGTSVTEIITGKADVIIEKLEQTLNNLYDFTAVENRQTFMSLVGNASNAMAQLNDLLTENKGALTGTMKNTSEMTREVSTFLARVNKTSARMDELGMADSLSLFVSNLTDITRSLKEAELVKLVRDLNVTINQTNKVITEFDETFARRLTDVGYSIQSIRESMEYLNEFSRLISEDPSIIVRGIDPNKSPDKKLKR